MVTGLPVVLLIVVMVVDVVHRTGAIDFGYHPSAEESDSLVRQSWGRDLLQRRVQDRRFVPRYQHQTSIRFEPPELDFQLFDEDQIRHPRSRMSLSLWRKANRDPQFSINSMCRANC